MLKSFVSYKGFSLYYKGFSSYYKLKSVVTLQRILVCNAKEILCNTKKILCNLRTIALYYLCSKSYVIQSIFCKVVTVHRFDDNNLVFTGRYLKPKKS